MRRGNGDIVFNPCDSICALIKLIFNNCRLKKMRHVLQEASAEAFSEQHQHHNDEEERSKRVLKKKNPKLRDVNWRFLDVEAAL